MKKSVSVFRAVRINPIPFWVIAGVVAWTACSTPSGSGSDVAVVTTGGHMGPSASGGQTGSGGAASGGQSVGGGSGGRGPEGGASGGQTASGGAASGGQTFTNGTGGASGQGGRAGMGNGGTGTGGAGAGGGVGAGGVGAGGMPVAPAGVGACKLPVGANFADVQTAYAKFKTDLVTTAGAGGFLRILRPNSPGAMNTSNSEGIGYGMIIAVYMNEQTFFDQLWKYEQLHLRANGLMDWQINPEGTAASGTGAATDGDEDMAFALVMADKKWGGSGTLSDTYLNLAKKQIDLIWQFEVDQTRGFVVAPGDSFGGGGVINISYFAPAFYRIFGQATGKTADWAKVVESSYLALNAALNATNQNVTNGLVPAWSTPAGVPQAPNAALPTYHQLDSSRTPFRIAQDYCWFNEPRALTYLQKITSFYSGIGAANILDGYNLNGMPFAGAGSFPAASLHLAAFVGPAGVGAMATPAYATLRDQAYVALVTPPGLLGGSLYYNESWTVLSLLMMTGHYLNLAN